MKKFALSFILCAISIISVQAQSLFLGKGQNGFGVSAGFSTNENGSGFSGSAGYSFSGVLDLGISVGRYGYDQLFFGEDIKATVISPFVSYLIIKQDEQIPVSFALNGSYMRGIYSSELLRDNNINMTGNTFTIGASLYSIFIVSEAMKIQPGIGFAYLTGNTKIGNSIGSETESFNSTLFSMKLSLIFHTSPTNIFVVSPELGFGDNVTSFGVSIGLIFPQY